MTIDIPEGAGAQDIMRAFGRALGQALLDYRVVPDRAEDDIADYIHTLEEAALEVVEADRAALRLAAARQKVSGRWRGIK